MFDSLFNQVSGLQISNFIKKRFQHKCFSMNITKFLKTLILKKICERQCQLKYLSKKTVDLNVSQHLQENTFIGVSYLINIVAACCSIIFIQNKVPALVFSWQLSKIFNNDFFKEHCYKKKSSYKKRGSDIYRKSNYATFYLTSPRFLYFRTVHSDNGLYIVLSVEKNH